MIYLASHLGYIGIYAIAGWCKRAGIHVLVRPKSLVQRFLWNNHIPTEKGKTTENLLQAYRDGKVRDILLFAGPLEGWTKERYPLRMAKILQGAFPQEVRLVAASPYSLHVNVGTENIDLNTLDAEGLVKRLNALVGGSQDIYRVPLYPPTEEMLQKHPDSLWVDAPGARHYARSIKTRIAVVVVALVLFIGCTVGMFMAVNAFDKSGARALRLGSGRAQRTA